MDNVPTQKPAGFSLNQLEQESFTKREALLLWIVLSNHTISADPEYLHIPHFWLLEPVLPPPSGFPFRVKAEWQCTLQLLSANMVERRCYLSLIHTE